MPADLTNPIARNIELELLHPVVRKAVTKTLSDLKKAGIPLFVFEAFRSPIRQAHLFAQGRTRPGAKVTFADAWRSYHQYGLAVDLVFGGPGKWTWDEPKKGMWEEMHKIGAKQGLMPLKFETPHLQIAGMSSNALFGGEYPDDGDESWAENLASAIAAWTGEPQAPAFPKVFERPPLTG
jgi:peptidoglycan LD-endopeptidase CwlK